MYRTNRPTLSCEVSWKQNDYKYANNKSKFAQHVLDEGYSFGHMPNIMDIIHIEKKGRMLDTLEQYYIYRETQYGNQVNEIFISEKAYFRSFNSDTTPVEDSTHTHSNESHNTNVRPPTHSSSGRTSLTRRYKHRTRTTTGFFTYSG